MWRSFYASAARHRVVFQGCAVSEEAKRFYESCGFVVSPIEPITLMITVADAERALGKR